MSDTSNNNNNTNNNNSQPQATTQTTTTSTTTTTTEQKPPTNAEIIKGYNDTKQKYSLFFQKALEIEQELVEHK
jgi:hypothetical protein